jgi:hypothetical protein
VKALLTLRLDVVARMVQLIAAVLVLLISIDTGDSRLTFVAVIDMLAKVGLLLHSLQGHPSRSE